MTALIAAGWSLLALLGLAGTIAQRRSERFRNARTERTGIDWR